MSLEIVLIGQLRLHTSKINPCAEKRQQVSCLLYSSSSECTVLQQPLAGIISLAFADKVEFRVALKLL